jgi:hypothetical protein
VGPDQPVAPGPDQAVELTWQLILDDALIDEDGSGEPAPLSAFRQEFLEAGVDSAVELTRFFVHLSDDDLSEFVGEFTALIERYVSANGPRQNAGVPGYGVFFAVHRLRE